MKMTIENIIETVKIGTQCIMEGTTYEVTDIRPYSSECSIPQYTLKVIDKESIERRKFENNEFNKKNPYIKHLSIDEILTMDRIEPMWFIARKAKLTN
jgi:acyl-[acyl carrier protein]--UDP-N-acetylglucosamine O-acyltransferase